MPFLQDVWPALSAVVAALVVFAGFACLGSLVGSGRRWRAADPLIGWGMGGGWMTVVGVAFPTGLPAAAVLLGLAALAAAFRAARRRDLPGGPILWLAVVLMLPWLFLLAKAGPAEWDDFSHWLLNAGYLYRFDAFPNRDLPASISVWPGYPYGLPLWHWLTSQIAGRFVEMASAMANLLLLSALGATAATVLLSGGGGEGRLPAGRGAAWGAAALAVLLGTVASPSFAKGYALTAYADAATAVALGFAGLFGWALLERIAADPTDRKAILRLVWQFGFSVVALINVKQANLVLLAFLLAGFVLAGFRTEGLPWRRWLKTMAAALIPAAAVYLVWRYHVKIHMPGGEFGLLPRAAWHTDDLAAILAAVWEVASKKGGHYGMMAILTMAAFLSLFRPAGPRSRLLLVTATVFVAYTAFLIASYVVIFSRDEALRAASFWRYSTHIGGLGLLAALVALAPVLDRKLRAEGRRRIAAAAPALAMAIPALTLVAADHLVNRPSRVFAAALEAGRDLAESLPAGTRIAVASIGDAGASRYILGYALWRAGREDRGLRVSRHIDLATVEPGAVLGDPSLDAVLLIGPPGRFAGLDGVQADAEAVFLGRQDGNWQAIRQWR